MTATRAELETQAADLGIDNPAGFGNMTELQAAIDKATAADPQTAMEEQAAAIQAQANPEGSDTAEAREVRTELRETGKLRSGWTFDGFRVYPTPGAE